MSESPVLHARGNRWPNAIEIAASIAILFHVGAILLSILSAPSGPWPTDAGMELAEGPRFATSLYQWVDPYLTALHLNHNYHFPENLTANYPGPSNKCRLQIIIRDNAGKEIARETLPDPKAPQNVQHRQSHLADLLNRDELVEPRPGEWIPAPDQVVREVSTWEFPENQPGKIVRIAEHLIARDRPVMGPSPLSQVVMRSLVRHYSTRPGAKSVEIVRETKAFYPPEILTDASMRTGEITSIKASFGVQNVQGP